MSAHSRSIMKNADFQKKCLSTWNDAAFEHILHYYYYKKNEEVLTLGHYETKSNQCHCRYVFRSFQYSFTEDETLKAHSSTHVHVYNTTQQTYYDTATKPYNKYCILRLSKEWYHKVVVWRGLYYNTRPHIGAAHVQYSMYQQVQYRLD